MAKSATKNTVLKRAQPDADDNTLLSIVNNKGLKAKQKVLSLSQLLLEKKVTIDELTETAKTEKDVAKGTLIEAIEHTSKTDPEIVNEKTFEFLIQSLKEDAPRVKWEAARSIANTVHLFPKLLKKSIANLLANTEHGGTVVRWSAATALSKIIILNTPSNKELIPAAEAIIEWEQDNAVKKIYQQALKKAKK